jgi:hypothetical protein
MMALQNITSYSMKHLKIQFFFSSLQPGDSVLFKRGDTFSGAMNISRSGSSSSPIIIGAYGSGAKPVITALAPVSGWTNSGNIWTSNNTVSTLSRVNIVVMNNVNVPMEDGQTLDTERSTLMSKFFYHR